MARQAREKSKSGDYYIVLRGGGLYATDEDKKRFMEILAEKLEGGNVYGVHISENEIRMAVRENDKGISMNMKSVTTVYARYFNNAHNREGKLFEGRFKSRPLESRAEIDECVKSLSAGITAPKKAAPKASKPKTAPPKQSKAPKEEKPSKQEQSAPKKNLPSWLL